MYILVYILMYILMYIKICISWVNFERPHCDSHWHCWLSPKMGYPGDVSARWFQRPETWWNREWEFCQRLCTCCSCIVMWIILLMLITMMSMPNPSGSQKEEVSSAEVSSKSKVETFNFLNQQKIGRQFTDSWGYNRDTLRQSTWI